MENGTGAMLLSRLRRLLPPQPTTVAAGWQAATVASRPPCGGTRSGSRAGETHRPLLWPQSCGTPALVSLVWHARSASTVGRDAAEPPGGVVLVAPEQEQRIDKLLLCARPNMTLSLIMKILRSFPPRMPRYPSHDVTAQGLARPWAAACNARLCVNPLTLLLAAGNERSRLNQPMVRGHVFVIRQFALLCHPAQRNAASPESLGDERRGAREQPVNS
jgi:hypothetical protein